MAKKRKYKVSYFVRTYNEEDKLEYWAPCGELEVIANSPKEALDMTTSEILEKYEKNSVKAGDFLVDHIIKPDGTHLQCTAWDESGFPI